MVSLHDWTVLIFVSSFWSRVEFQAMYFMPWIALSTGLTPGSKSIFLSYTSMLVPTAIVNSIKNRHFLVSFTATISLILKLQVVLSTGLLFLAIVSQQLDDVPIQIQNAFLQDIPKANHSMNLVPYVVTLSMENLNLSYPEGTSPSFAFQSFDSDRYPSVDSPLQAVVDGLTMDVDCQPMTISGQGRWDNNSVPGALSASYQMTGTSPLCKKPFNWNIIINDNDVHKDIMYTGTYQDLGFENSSLCDSNGPARFLVGQAGFNFTYFEPLKLVQSAVLICTPVVTVSKVQVTRHGANSTVQLASNPENRTVTGDIVSLLMSMQAEYADRDPLVNTSFNNFDEYPEILDHAKAFLPGGNITSLDLVNGTTLTQLLRLYYRNYGSLLGYYGFMETAPTSRAISTTGSAYVTSNRLLVRTVHAYIMSGLFGVMTVLAVAIALFLLPQTGIAPCDPGSVIGFAIALSGSRNFLQRFSNTGVLPVDQFWPNNGASYRTAVVSSTPNVDRSPHFEVLTSDAANGMKYFQNGTQQQQSPSWYLPWVLRKGSRLSMSTALVLLIAGLAITLHFSEMEDGLGNVNEYTYLYFVWTSLPTAIMVAIALYFTSCDFQTRSLESFASLKERPCAINSLAASSHDQITAGALLTGVREGKWTVVLSTCLPLLSGFLTIFSGTLFTLTPTVTTLNTQLQAETWFASRDFGNGSFADKNLIGMLVLNDNFTYPKWTYNDVAFPNLSYVGPSDPALRSYPITATVRATRAQSNCTFQTNDTLTWFAQNPGTSNKTLFDYILKAPGNNCSGTSQNFTLLRFSDIQDANAGNIVYFGAGSAVGNTGENQCYDQMYAWGAFNRQAKRVDFVNAVLCFQGFVEVDADVRFTDADLNIDTTYPLVFNEGSARMLPYTLQVVAEYGLRIVDSTKGSPYSAFDVRFDPLFSSKWNMTAEDFGDPQMGRKIASVLEENDNINRMQSLSLNNRKAFNETSTLFPHSGNQTGPLNASALFSTYRLVQNPQPTYFLMSLLAAILVLNAVALIVTKTRVVPKDPKSIAAMSSLLADSNVFDWMPDGAQWMADEELAGLFRGIAFRMGWFSSHQTEEKFTIGVAEDGGTFRYASDLHGSIGRSQSRQE
jgi:Protein of unknown function (DUF3433)